MENLETIKADLQKSIDEAVVALKTKASNAEDLAQKAFDKAEQVLKSLDGVLSKEDASKMQDQLDKLDIAIQKSAVDRQVGEASFKDAFMKAYAPVQKEIERIKASGERLKAPMTFEIQEKTVGTISLASTLAAEGSSSQVTISEFTGVVSPIRQRLLTYLSNVSVGAICKQYAVWVEEHD